MKVFYNYIVDYFKHEFELTTHVFLGLFLAISIYLNYWFFPYVIYDNLVDNHPNSLKLVFYLFVFFLLPFLISSVIVLQGKSELSKKQRKNYFLIGGFSLFLLGLDCSYYVLPHIVDLYHFDYLVDKWLRACISNLTSLGTIIIPLYIIYYGTKHFKPEFYGLRLNGAKVLPYLWLILFMLPLIFLASFQPDFLATYPSYPDNFEYLVLGIDQWITAGIYELCYGFDFISVELFFRGFMVIALSKFVGKDAILPMVVVYCFLHFGKPAGEAISSIFGGYILGILAYKSRNIYGGLIAHLGVAWGMELMAYLQS